MLKDVRAFDNFNSEKNQCYGVALIYGFNIATGNNIVSMDSDGLFFLLSL